MPNRREFLAGAAVAVLVPSFARASSLDRARDDNIHVNGWLEGFPCADEIPGIAATTHLLHPQAKKGLVVFEQSHYVPDPTDEQCDEIDDCQLDLYRAMLHLMYDSNVKMDSIMVEGVRDESDELYEENPVLQKSLRDEKIISKRIGNISALGRFGAAGILLHSYGLRILSAEDPEVEKRADELVETEDRNKWGPVVYKEREDALVRLAAEMRDKIVYTVFGHNHKWGDNIEEWNKLHPELPFSALVLTPESIITNNG